MSRCFRYAFGAEWDRGSHNKSGPQLFDNVGYFGSGGRDRTYDKLINSQLLYP